MASRPEYSGMHRRGICSIERMPLRLGPRRKALSYPLLAGEREVLRRDTLGF